MASSYSSSSNLICTNGSSNPNATTPISSESTLSRLSTSSSEKLKNLKITKKEPITVFMHKEISSSKLINISSNGHSINDTTIIDPEYDEVTVTIRKSERGFGFDLKNGILVQNVYPNTPAFNSGIRVGDIILKVNGTCVRSKDQNEITNMIYESNSFVSLTLQRKKLDVGGEGGDETSGGEMSKMLKNVTNQLTNKDQNDSDENISTTNNNNNNNTTSNNHINTSISNIRTGSSGDFTETENNENNLIAGSLNSADSVANSMFNTNEQTSLGKAQQQQQQQSLVSDDQTANNNLSLMQQNKSNSAASNRRTVKKTRSSTNSKTLTTQSLSNIIVPSLVHSISDNDLDNQNKQQLNVDSFDHDFIDYKDDLSYTSEDYLNETNNDKSLFDMSGYNDYSQLITKPVNLSILLKYLLGTENESPKYLYFCMFTDDLINSNEKKEILLKWMYELYTTFLMNGSPLKLKVNETSCKKLEDLFERNPLENISFMKRLFGEIKQEAVEVVNIQLSRFSEVKQIGLANLFQGSEMLKLTQVHKSDFETVKNTILEGFSSYINEIAKDIVKINGEWNGVGELGQQSALISSFVTFVKRLNLPLKLIGKLELEKIPVFISKKSKTKKPSNHTVRGHNFTDYSFLSVRAVCSKCNQPFWGIGYQGLICQKYKCDVKVHRNCLANVTGDCHGSQKTIRTDYKEKLDNIQKMIFGKKEPAAPIDITHVPKNSHFMPGSGSIDSGHSALNAEDGQGNYSNEYDIQNGNLPVDIAIQKFESLTAKKSTQPSLITSPTANLNNITLTRTSTLNNGNRSPPTGVTNIHRHNSVNNNFSASYTEHPSYSHTTSGKKEYKSIHSQIKDQQQILPNKQPNHHNNNNNNNHEYSSANGSNQNQHNSNSTSSKSNKDQACKRVGSLKVDCKKIKSNVTRSKSDPEPEEIKNAISSSNFDTLQENYNNINSILINRFINDSSSTIIDQNEGSFANAQKYNSNSNSNSLSYRTSGSPSSSHYMDNKSYMGTSERFSTASSASNLTNNSSSSSRQSWMNGSDMEFDEELPMLSIDKQQLGQLTDKEIKTQEVINELIHTEQKHVRNLKIMKNHFYLPVKINLLLTKEDINVLFPNLEEVLELHANFNNKLKRLRKENPIVPLKQLINIILDQFKGAKGEKFKTECAKFCENQSQAMKLLQERLKNNEKFSQFISVAENHPICRKLQLKDFIPTEVQRLVKYKLLFQELTKNATNQEDKERLLECMDASSEISLYINKAVTECENRKRVEEIQSRMDTKEFDQYCSKSSLLSQYKNLDLRSRKLIYEGELEWKIHGSMKLMALLFEDVLIFLERSTDEKRRYILKPLAYSINKSKQVFTPVIPLSCINNFQPMHEKRFFHLVVLIDEKLPTNVKSQIQTQMLFIFIAKSGDERNKWTAHLQRLTGKLSQTADGKSGTIDLRLHQQSSTSSLTSLNSNNSSSNTVSSSNLSNPSSFKTSVSASTLNTPTISENFDKNISDEKLAGIKEANFTDSVIESQLKENTQNIIDLLKTRHSLLSKLESTSSIDIDDESMLDENINEPDILLNCLTSTLSSLTQNIMAEDMQKMNQNVQKSATTSEPLLSGTKLIKDLHKLEVFLGRLRSNLLEQSNQRLIQTRREAAEQLPSLKLPLTAHNSDSGVNMMNQNQSINRSNSSSNVRGRSKAQPGHYIDAYNNSELVSSSIISSSTNADLSEDEQINYYDENVNFNLNSNGTDDCILPLNETNLDNSNRSLSTSSDQTLIPMPTNPLISETVNVNYKLNKPPINKNKTQQQPSRLNRSNNRYSEDYDDVDDAATITGAGQLYENSLSIEEDYERKPASRVNEQDQDQSVVIKLSRINSNLEKKDRSRDDYYKRSPNSAKIPSSVNYDEDEHDDDEDADDDDEYDQSDVDERNRGDSRRNRNNVHVGFVVNDADNEHNGDDDDDDDDVNNINDLAPTPPSSEPPSLTINNSSLGNASNDLSDDEVKEYHVFKENFYDDSNV